MDAVVGDVQVPQPVVERLREGRRTAEVEVVIAERQHAGEQRHVDPASDIVVDTRHRIPGALSTRTTLTALPAAAASSATSLSKGRSSLERAAWTSVVGRMPRVRRPS